MNKTLLAGVGFKTIKSKQEEGIVLYVAIVMLFIMALIGLSGLVISSNTEHISLNERDTNISFQAAETALLAGERAAVELTSPTSPFAGRSPSDIFQKPTIPNPKGLYIMQPDLALWKTDAFDVWEDGSVEVTSASVAAGSMPPRYILEFIGVVQDESGSSKNYIDQNQYEKYQGGPEPVWLLRVTALGYGANNETSTMLQSLVRVDQG